MTTANKKTSFLTRFVGIFLSGVLVLAFAMPSAPAFAQGPDQSGGGDTSANPQDESEDGETCAIEKVGWILCPIMESVAKAADKTYEILANNFLQIEPELLTAKPDGGKGTITAWEYARNVANIAFIIAFLVIIYSQVTGAGLNNYGIKRMLPRLIIAAIAVNISYYICQAMVDLTNILGFEIKGALTNVANQIGPAVMGADAQGTNTQTGSGTLGTLSKITIAVLAVGAVVWIFTGLMGSIGLLILITVVTIIIILLLRKAFIVILVVLSPLAFVAYLLPNTEKLFSKWLNMFWQLLLVFPIVSLLFGGGQLASTVILVAGSGANSSQSSQQDCSAGSTPTVQQSNNGYSVPCEKTIDIGSGNNKKPAGWMLGLVAAGIAIAPLLFVWSVLKGALAAAGAIGGKLAGAIQDASKGKREDLRKRYQDDKERRKQNREIRALQGGGIGTAINVATLGSARRKARRRAGIDRTKARYNEAYVDYVANASTTRDENGNVNGVTGFGRRLSGGIGPYGNFAGQDAMNRTMGDAVNAQREIEVKNVKAAHATVDNIDVDQLFGQLFDNQGNATGNREDPRVAAALERIARAGSSQQIQQAVNAYASGGRSTTASRSLGSTLAADNPGYLRSANIDAISRGMAGGANSYENMALQNVRDGIFSQEKMATAAPGHLEYASQVANAAGDAAAVNTLRQTARALNDNEKLRGSIGRARNVINGLDGRQP